MPWSAHYDPETRIVTLSYSGVIALPDLMAAFGEGLRLGAQHKTDLFLGDCTALTKGPSVAELYLLAEKFGSDGTKFSVKQAIILPSLPDASTDLHFWETTTQNHGFTTSVFSDHLRAEKWLLSHDTRPKA